MVEIQFIFSSSLDVHKFHQNCNELFSGSEVLKNNYVIVNPIVKDTNGDKTIYSFLLDIFTGESDTTVEKKVTVTGGILDLLINNGKNVWAFS